MADSALADVLKTLMFKKNMNTTQLAKQVDLPQQTLQRIVSGASPNPHKKTLNPLAVFFDISVEQLKGLEPLPENLTTLDLTASANSTRKVPILNWNAITETNNATASDYVTFNQAGDRELVATQLPDTSMEPYFTKGSTLIVDKQAQAKDRDFVLVKAAGLSEVLFRQLLRDGEYSYLKPLNPDLKNFPMRLLSNQDEIIAVLVECRVNFENL